MAILRGSRLHSWLRRSPMPAAVRCDAKKTIAVGTNSKTRWRDVMISIDAVGANLLEALDAEGNVLRAMVLEDEDEDEHAKPTEEPKAVNGEHRDVAIARLVLEATDRGALRNADAYKAGFDKLSHLVEMLLQRTTALEGIWQRTLENRAAELETQPEAEGGGLEAMLASVLPGLVARNTKPAVADAKTEPPKPTNGKAKS